VQFGLRRLRRELTRHGETGTPWHARHALDVIALLDMPAWAALCGLIAECPVMLANVSSAGTSRPLSIDVSKYEFISGNRQIGCVRLFMESLPQALG
jgi:hypothetical protein